MLVTRPQPGSAPGVSLPPGLCQILSHEAVECSGLSLETWIITVWAQYLSTSTSHLMSLDLSSLTCKMDVKCPCLGGL